MSQFLNDGYSSRRERATAENYLRALHHSATIDEMKCLQATFCVGVAVFLAIVLAVPSIAFLHTVLPDSQRLFVTTLDAIPDDGVARMFQVCRADRDAWVRQPDRVCGQCYLLRQGDRIQALLPITSRGTSIFYNRNEDVFEDVCFGVQFERNGQVRRECDRHFMLPLRSIPITADKQGIWIESANHLGPIIRFGRFGDEDDHARFH